MISSSQIKAARAMLGWSALKLADFSGIGPATIRRYELQQGIPSANINVLQKIKSVLESSGIQFTGDPLINPGVTLDLSKREAALGRQ
jgi:transcriptional regulator with XRE-family HTH domain